MGMGDCVEWGDVCACCTSADSFGYGCVGVCVSECELQSNGCLGKGSSGHVIRVKHHSTGVVYALKTFSSRRRWETEWRGLRAMGVYNDSVKTHMHSVVRVVGAVHPQHRRYCLLLSPCTANGETLEHVLQNPCLRKPLACIRDSWRKQLEDACVAMSQAGVQHGDLKAKNVLLTGLSTAPALPCASTACACEGRQRVVICDFDLASVGHEPGTVVYDNALGQLEEQILKWRSWKTNQVVRLCLRRFDEAIERGELDYEDYDEAFDIWYDETASDVLEELEDAWALENDD